MQQSKNRWESNFPFAHSLEKHVVYIPQHYPHLSISFCNMICDVSINTCRKKIFLSKRYIDTVAKYYVSILNASKDFVCFASSIITVNAMDVTNRIGVPSVSNLDITHGSINMTLHCKTYPYEKLDGFLLVG